MVKFDGYGASFFQKAADYINGYAEASEKMKNQGGQYPPRMISYYDTQASKMKFKKVIPLNPSMITSDAIHGLGPDRKSVSDVDFEKPRRTLRIGKEYSDDDTEGSQHQLGRIQTLNQAHLEAYKAGSFRYPFPRRVQNVQQMPDKKTGFPLSKQHEKRMNIPQHLEKGVFGRNHLKNRRRKVRILKRPHNKIPKHLRKFNFIHKNNPMQEKGVNPPASLRTNKRPYYTQTRVNETLSLTSAPLLVIRAPPLEPSTPELETGSPPLKTKALPFETGSPTAETSAPALKTSAPALKTSAPALKTSAPRLETGSPSKFKFTFIYKHSLYVYGIILFIILSIFLITLVKRKWKSCGDQTDKRFSIGDDSDCEEPLLKSKSPSSVIGNSYILEALIETKMEKEDSCVIQGITTKPEENMETQSGMDKRFSIGEDTHYEKSLPKFKPYTSIFRKNRTFQEFIEPKVEKEDTCDIEMTTTKSEENMEMQSAIENYDTHCEESLPKFKPYTSIITKSRTFQEFIEPKIEKEDSCSIQIITTQSEENMEMQSAIENYDTYCEETLQKFKTYDSIIANCCKFQEFIEPKIEKEDSCDIEIIKTQSEENMEQQLAIKIYDTYFEETLQKIRPCTSINANCCTLQELIEPKIEKEDSCHSEIITTQSEENMEKQLAIESHPLPQFKKPYNLQINKRISIGYNPGCEDHLLDLEPITSIVTNSDIFEALIEPEIENEDSCVIQGPNMFEALTESEIEKEDSYAIQGPNMFEALIEPETDKDDSCVIQGATTKAEENMEKQSTDESCPLPASKRLYNLRKKLATRMILMQKSSTDEGTHKKP